MKLTARQEQFAINLFKGMTQRQAWVEAGYSNNYSIAIVDTHASVLADSDKIKVRLKELREPTVTTATMEVSEKREFYAEIKRNGKEETITRLRATDYDSKLARHYEETPVWQDNRQWNIIVQGDEARKKVYKLLSGERPKEG